MIKNSDKYNWPQQIWMAVTLMEERIITWWGSAVARLVLRLNKTNDIAVRYLGFRGELVEKGKSK